eukprot:15330481-Ditylum_brightwellii.AAC.1
MMVHNTFVLALALVVSITASALPPIGLSCCNTTNEANINPIAAVVEAVAPQREGVDAVVQGGIIVYYREFKITVWHFVAALVTQQRCAMQFGKATWQ